MYTCKLIHLCRQDKGWNCYTSNRDTNFITEVIAHNSCKNLISAGNCANVWMELSNSVNNMGI